MNTIQRLTLPAGFILGLFFCVYIAQAQDPMMPTATVENVPIWVNHIGEQLAQELESPVEEIRHQALQHISYFASFYGDRLDLSASLPKLLEIYKKDDNEQCRLLALASIHSIGDHTTMQEVRRLTGILEEPSMRLQLVSMAALADFYGVETFSNDREATRLAKALFDYYTNPRVIIHPPVVVPPNYDQ